jgi:hypothetical protein
MIQFTKFFKNNKVALFIYLVINYFFLLKYADRQEFVPKFLVLLLYNIVIILTLYLIDLFKNYLNKIKNNNYYFLGFCLIVFIIFMAINIFVDGNSINSDRWSAMDVTIRGVLNGEYPYSLKDHLGQTSSNLPGLFYIGLPFYLLGNVSLLQPFVFLIISLLIFKSRILIDKKLTLIFLLIASPAYLWEIIAKSDLFSNIILLVFFLILWDFKFKSNYFKYPFLLSFFCAFLILTRGIVVIPLTLFLFRGFINTSINKKLKFSFGLVFFIILISLPFILKLPGFEIIKEHNPFNHQTRFTPKWMQIVFVVLPFILAIKIKKIQQVIFQSLILLSLLLFLSFVIEIIDEGFKNTLYKSYFDISYLTIAMPFAILYYVFKTKKFGGKLE